MDETLTDTSRGTSAARGSEQAQGPAPDVVRQHLTGQFATAYLTLASIIQGVALTTLVSRVEAAYSGFAVADWLLSATTFLAILTVWNEYLMQALAYVWLPTFLDSLVPFGFVVAELLLAHLVYHTERTWLLAYGGFYLVGVAAWALQNRQIRTSIDEESRRTIGRGARSWSSSRRSAWPRGRSTTWPGSSRRGSASRSVRWPRGACSWAAPCPRGSGCAPMRGEAGAGQDGSGALVAGHAPSIYRLTANGQSLRAVSYPLDSIST